MPTALLVPVSVTAKVIVAEKQVPALQGDPFNLGSKLEPGVHVHWALPDALTRARVPQGSQKTALFPAIPDYWLVVRLNPPPANPGNKHKRVWSAWVVDSRRQTVTPLSQWNPDPVAADAPVNTVAGLLPVARDYQLQGWGVWTKDQPFDIANAAYYPSARNRFGFWDKLEGLPRQGKATYSVVGWYSNRAHDPLYTAADRADLLKYWKLAYSHRKARWSERAAGISLAGAASTAQQWRPEAFKLSENANPPAHTLRRAARMDVRGASVETMKARVQATSRSVPIAAAGEATHAGIRHEVEFLSIVQGPTEIVCHGAVVEVPLAGVAEPANLTQSQARVYPSITRAMAALAAVDGSGQTLDQVEMMLDNLESQKGALSGIVDLPGAAHAKTFQAMAGKTKRYARIEVHASKRGYVRQQNFTLLTKDAVRGDVPAGNWPLILERSAMRKTDMRIDRAQPKYVLEQANPAPTGPTEAQITEWLGKLSAAIASLKNQGVLVDERMVRVQDYRKNAPLSTSGKSVDRTGSDGSGFWLDLTDLETVKEFYRVAWDARIYLPDPDNLYELPGPNWYRPWSPQVVLTGVKRSYRFGADGRFTTSGYLQCRTSGEVLAGLKVAQSPSVYGRQAVSSTGILGSNADLPPEAKTLVEEVILLDTESAPILASHVAGQSGAATSAQFRGAVEGLWLLRDRRLTADMREQIEAGVKPIGEVPSPVAVTPWSDPLDPLYIDVNYAHPHSSVAADWDLKHDHVETEPTKVEALQPPAGQVAVIQERARVTASLMKVLQKKLVTNWTIDHMGRKRPTGKAPNGVDDQTFEYIDVLSAPLGRFDEKIFGEAGLRERSGALRLNRLDVVDVFGIRRTWTGVPAGSENSPTKFDQPWWTEIHPRLPYWARLQHRLLAASEDPSPAAQVEADTFHHPICGFLLPDFIEHSLEVFDGDGRAVGQLAGDRPQLGNANPRTLKATFTPHPWLSNAGASLDAIKNPVLRQVVAGLEAQSTVIPATPSPGWHETGLTGFLRVVDTVRATLDPTVKSPDRKVRLLGEAIVVLNTRYTLEATATPNVSDLSRDPALLPPGGNMPNISVQVGSVSRPDDGVLGCFLPGATAPESKFAPVSKEAAQHALINGLVMGTGAGKEQSVTHPFIAGLDTEFTLGAGGTKDVIVLMDTRGGIYSTCAVLPRKKIVIPREHLDAALRNLEASFRMGPILGLPTTDTELKPAIAPVDLEGYATEFVRLTNGAWVERPVPEVAPVAELPTSRVRMTSGFLRLARVEKEDTP